MTPSQKDNDIKLLKAQRDALKNALIATWIILESDPEQLIWMNNCRSSKTGETLESLVRRAIAEAE